MSTNTAVAESSPDANRVTEVLLMEAQRHLRDCQLCEHRCGVDRTAGGRGPCHAAAESRIFRHRIEVSEEPQIRPSQLLYLSGCDLRCKFCIAEAAAFDPKRGSAWDADWLRTAIAWGQARGAKTLQFVGGEPTIHLPHILSVLADVDDVPPLVWKSDFHWTPSTGRMLLHVADYLIADYKFGNDRCGQAIASIDHYTTIIQRNLLLAATSDGLIVRHLLLPGHFDCCFRSIVDWMSLHLPHVPFSLRTGYLPRWQSHRDDNLMRLLTVDEVKQATEYARERLICLIL